MLTKEQKARLDPEQLAIAEKWEVDREKLNSLFEQLARAVENNDDALWKKAQQNLRDNPTPSRCEHDRSIWSPCGACEEIEQLLYPEYYDENGDRLPDEEIEIIALAKSPDNE